MDLKEFISESIVEIVEGIVDAQSRIKSDDALIIPSVQNVFTQSQSGGTNLAIGWDKKGNMIHSVEFDVAVTSSEGTETKGGIGVVAGIVALGSQGKSLENNQSISRLKFRIPISFPRHDAPET